MEHLLIQGGEIWLPFARGRIRALKAAGLEYASQKFDMGDGSVVKVRYTPWDEYIDIQGTYTSYLIKHESTDAGDDYLLPSKPEFKAKKNGKDLDAGVMDWRGKGGRYLTYNPGTFQRYRLADKTDSFSLGGRSVLGAENGIWVSGNKIDTPFTVVAAAIYSPKNKPQKLVAITFESGEAHSSPTKLVVMAQEATGWVEVGRHVLDGDIPLKLKSGEEGIIQIDGQPEFSSDREPLRPAVYEDLPHFSPTGEKFICMVTPFSMPTAYVPHLSYFRNDFLILRGVLETIDGDISVKFIRGEPESPTRSKKNWLVIDVDQLRADTRRNFSLSDNFYEKFSTTFGVDYLPNGREVRLSLTYHKSSDYSLKETLTRRYDTQNVPQGSTLVPETQEIGQDFTRDATSRDTITFGIVSDNGEAVDFTTQSTIAITKLNTSNTTPITADWVLVERPNNEGGTSLYADLVYRVPEVFSTSFEFSEYGRVSLDQAVILHAMDSRDSIISLVTLENIVMDRKDIQTTHKVRGNITSNDHEVTDEKTRETVTKLLRNNEIIATTTNAPSEELYSIPPFPFGRPRNLADATPSDGPYLANLGKGNMAAITPFQKLREFWICSNWKQFSNSDIKTENPVSVNDIKGAYIIR